MDISCPVCKFKGSMPDNLIPEKGKRVACPRCKARIFIRKPVVSLTAGKRARKKTPRMEVVGLDRPISNDEPGAEVIRARCQNCGGQITVPSDKKLLLCPGCGATIVRQVIDEELEPGFIEDAIQTIVGSFRSVFKGWGKYTRGRAARRVVVVVLVLAVPYLLFYGLKKGANSPAVSSGEYDVTVNFPDAEDEPPAEGGTWGFLKSLIRIDVAPSNENKDEIRIYQIVFNDGSRSDYFRYYRRTGDILYIMLPNGEGGSYELGYDYADIRSIKRIRDLPVNVKVYGVN